MVQSGRLLVGCDLCGVMTWCILRFFVRYGL
jgi:hypothetical protein